MVVSGLFHGVVALTAGKNPGTHSEGDWFFYVKKVLS
jgi:hypothetical protein